MCILSRPRTVTKQIEKLSLALIHITRSSVACQWTMKTEYNLKMALMQKFVLGHVLQDTCIVWEIEHISCSTLSTIKISAFPFVLLKLKVGILLQLDMNILVLVLLHKNLFQGISVLTLKFISLRANNSFVYISFAVFY